MFDIARAALLSSGIPEHKLPRTHSGVIAAFGRRAVQSGAIDAELARSLSRTEGLRLRADYTGTQIDPKKAADTVAEAEAFVATVERTFELGAPHLEADRDHDKPKGGDTVSEPDVGVQQWKANYPHPNPFSLEDEQRQARENWLRLRQQATNAEVKIDKERAAGQAAENDRGYSASLDFDD
jgi:uncharacterized protein (UPF0332 family)